MKNSIFISTNLKMNTGGGMVSKYELEALKNCTDVKLILADARYDISPFKCESINPRDYRLSESPFLWDYLAQEYVDRCIIDNRIDVIFINGNPFGRTTASAYGIYQSIYATDDSDKKPIVIVDLPAHDLKDSIDEHQKAGINYADIFPHNVDEFLMDMQMDHIINADKLIFPSRYSKLASEKLNLIGDQELFVIPHGVNLPNDSDVKPIPEEFRIGYVGSLGIDKGVAYLIAAWNNLGYKNSVFGYAGPHQDAFDKLKNSVKPQKGSLYKNLGWVENTNELYNNISVYIQPSVCDGFGLEVLEAMSYGRPVIVSDGAGASEIVEENSCGFVFEKRNVKELMKHIQYFKDNPSEIKKLGERARRVSLNYSWSEITREYEKVIES